jgi:hypothetical protein
VCVFFLFSSLIPFLSILHLIPASPLLLMSVSPAVLTSPTYRSDSRLDGSTSRPRRALDIRLFQQANSPTQIFLISTKAGGLGINLTAATNVVMYDQGESSSSSISFTYSPLLTPAFCPLEQTGTLKRTFKQSLALTVSVKRRQSSTFISPSFSFNVLTL